MLVVVAIALAATIVASFAVNGRLFIYRHDQAWRRERGAWFGDWPLSHGWENIYNRSDYAPEGHRLIPFAIALQLLGVLLFVVTFTLIVRAV
jgi:hypothetical protein